MKILDKYVLKEMIAPFLVSVFAFVVLLVGRIVFDNISFIVEKNVPLRLVVRLIVFQLPWAIGIVIPLATLFATSLSVNRLTKDSEMTAIRMAGTPVRRIFAPILVVGLLASALTLWVGESITPWANHKAQETVRYILGMQQTPPIRENVFFQSENYYFYVQHVEKDSKSKLKLDRVMIYETPLPGEYPLLITAAWATNEGNVWSLHDGVSHKLGPDGMTQYDMKFPLMQINLNKAVEALWDSQKTTEEMSFKELDKQIQTFGGASQDVTKLKVDWNFKLSLPLSCLIFALCAAPLSLRFSRFGSYSGILMGILIMFFYWNNILLGKALGVGGKVPPFVAGWSQNIIFALIGLYLMWREE